MANQKKRIGKTAMKVAFLALLAFVSIPAFGQQAGPRDPAEPAKGKPQVTALARPVGRVVRAGVDEKSMRALIGRLGACATRLTLSSWEERTRGARCGRAGIAAG